MDRRRFLRNMAVFAAGSIAADQLELLEKLSHKRRYFPGANFDNPHFMVKEFDLGFSISKEMLEDDFYWRDPISGLHLPPSSFAGSSDVKWTVASYPMGSARALTYGEISQLHDEFVGRYGRADDPRAGQTREGDTYWRSLESGGGELGNDKGLPAPISRRKWGLF